MAKGIHPIEALRTNQRNLPILPVCEHIAGNEKLIRKSFALQQELGPVFDITLDCEDGAKQGEELEHARMVAELLDSDENAHGLTGFRIHPIESEFWEKELEIILPIAGNKVQYVTVPKATSPAGVQRVVDKIEALSKAAGLKNYIFVHVLIETHSALAAVDSIASISAVQVLDFGIMDFIAEHNGAISVENIQSPGQFEHELVKRAKTNIAAAALAHGVVPSHNVTVDIKNVEKTRADAKRARDQFGFLRMWSVYPTQIQAIVDAMRPDHSELERAVEVLCKAQDANWGPITVDDQLHDAASFRSFWFMLQRARGAGMELPGEALRRWFG